MTANEHNDPARIVDWFLADETLPVSPEHDCPYLPDRRARTAAFLADQTDPEIYTELMNRGFRRSGKLIYRPACEGCDECRPLRVPVDDFAPSRSQRRVRRRNADLTVEVGPPELTDEKFRIFVAYLDAQHDRTMSRDRDTLNDFLYESPVDTLEICYRLGPELVAVSLVDRSDRALSSVYVYFDPKHRRRSPGTYAALWEIDYCRRIGLPYYYLGYYVAGSKTMDYKVRFGPCEILDPSLTWISPPRPR